DAVDEVDRRARPVQLLVSLVGRDEAPRIARLELVRVRLERREVADAEVADARLEDVMERDRRDRGVAARTGAFDRQPVPVDESTLGEGERAVDAVVDVDGAPRAIEPPAVLAPVARGTAVVDVEDGDA